jgi:hypothetical protein
MMKRIPILIAAALTLAACGKSEIPVYRLEDSAVCFQSVNNNFSMRSLTEPTRDLTIPVVLIGQVTDYARPISFSRDGGTAVEGQDYTLVSAEVPAGSLTGSIVLRANRLEGITEKSLDLTIHPNEHFREGYPAKLKAHVIWTESYERPAMTVWRYWYLYISHGYSRDFHKFLVEQYGDDIERYTCSKTYAEEDPTLIYKLPTWWFNVNREIRETVRDHDLAHPDAPYRHSADYESYKGYGVPVGEGDKAEGLPPTFLETLTAL